MILFDETGSWWLPPGSAGQLFPDGAVSNRQLQVTTLVACLWCCWLAAATGPARSAPCSRLLLAGRSAWRCSADFGLRDWLGTAARTCSRCTCRRSSRSIAGRRWRANAAERAWFAGRSIVAAALLFVVLLDLLALDGRSSTISGSRCRPGSRLTAANPMLLDTLAAMTLNGLVFYAVAALSRAPRNRPDVRRGGLLFAIARSRCSSRWRTWSGPARYSLRYDWIYLGAGARRSRSSASSASARASTTPAC